ncbi:MAG: Ureidoglycolate lyase [Alphaproteobacteria bacterium MarineAlpha2_Bin1]|nr:MAG: Ureidoglycolate lyase [Alphaproteobacteria bacterium MarineAlpha2_Bin1]
MLKKNNYLIPEIINKEKFKPYGDLIEKPLLGNRTDFVANLQKSDEAKNQSISITRIEFSKGPISIDLLEKHLHTSQTFFPMDVEKYLIVVAPDKLNQPDVEKIKAFIVPGTMAINYYLGTWHSPMQVLERDGVFAILMYLLGSDRDQQWSKIDKVMVKIN